MNLNKKQIEFLKNHNIEIVPEVPFEELAIKALQNFATNKNWKILNKTYSNNAFKYTWQCEKGHIWKANWGNIYRERGCPRCKKRVVYIEDLHEAAKLKDGKLLSTKYETDRTKYKWQCKNEHIFHTAWHLVKQGNWCRYCAKVERPNINIINQTAISKGGKCLNPEIYKNNSTKLKWECSEGHIWKASWKGIGGSRPTWCPRCSKINSKAELEIMQYVESLGFKSKKQRFNRHSKYLEIDVFVPEKLIGIEYHGLYWHSSAIRENSLECKTKYKFFKEKGIDLIQIFEDEWLEKSDIVKSIINNKLGINSIKLNARKGEVRIIDYKEAKEFLSKSHINGYTKSDIKLGLFINEKLESVLTIRKPFSKRYKDCLEISRFASSINTSVRGGFQKLLKVAKVFIKEQGYNKLLTYADLRFGSGKVYANSGFQYIGETVPNYFYTKAQKRESRQKHKKINDPKYIEKWGSSEIEQNHNQNWFKIYDAGSNIYLLEF